MPAASRCPDDCLRAFLQDLLGTDFKRRMVMDGQVHAITFICTKTDNLDVSN